MKLTLAPHQLVILICIIIFSGIVAVKLIVFDYHPDQVIPLEGWQITVSLAGSGNGQDISMTHFLPGLEPGQSIEKERFSGSYSRYTTAFQKGNRSVTYSFHQPFGPVQASCAFLVIPQELRFSLPDSLALPVEAGSELLPYLEEEKLIQKNAPEISAKARSLGLSAAENGMIVIKKIFDYCHDSIQTAKFSGETDALLTCRLGEGSCNGKSRLMVALLRNEGIPSRLVGGLILQGRDKKTTHQWVEVCINDKWVSFCPLNGYYGVKPSTYVAFYRGDHNFFRHTKDIKFSYSFSLSPTLIPRDRNFTGHNFLDITNVWQLLEKSGIPLSTLGLILVIPIGALVTIIFRNVLGVQTYGTFLPALIAYAFQGTGLLWGMTIFFIMIAGGASLDALVSRLKLLHTPRLTVVMLFVVAVLLTFGVWGIRNGNPSLAYSLFFPLAIHTITIERFFVVAQERGMKKSFTILGWSMLVVAFCYMVMSSLSLQMIIVFFPETYLLVLAAAVYLGRWSGLRASEFYRFRSLIFSENESKTREIE